MAEQQNNREEQELNHLLKVRREKLSELCESGRDPFQITKYDVTAHSMEVKGKTTRRWRAKRYPWQDE